MNRMLLLLMTSIIGLFSVSCGDENKQTLEVKPVTGLTSEVGPGNVLLKWEKPNIVGISYVEIVYKKDGGEENKVLVNGQVTEKLISGFGDQNLYTFTVAVIMEDGTKSTPQTIQVIPGPPEFENLLETIVVTNNFGGVDLRWDNQSDDKFYIHVSYKDDNDEVHISEVDVADRGAGKQYVGITGVLNANLKITVADEAGNVSEEKPFNFTNLERGKLDRSIWEVVYCSSQEEKGEAAPNGLAKVILDGDKATFWHSQWYPSNVSHPSFPHWMIFDLKRKVRLTRVEISHRASKIMAKGIELQGSNVYPAADNEWNSFVVFDMPQTAGATKIVKFDAPVEYRYVKMIARTAGNGSAQFASLSEFVLYGEDILEDK